MAGGREEVQGKRGGGEVGWRGAGERRRKKRTCFREASRQFAYFNEFIIFLKEHLYHMICLFFYHARFSSVVRLFMYISSFGVREY